MLEGLFEHNKFKSYFYLDNSKRTGFVSEEIKRALKMSRAEGGAIRRNISKLILPKELL